MVNILDWLRDRIQEYYRYRLDKKKCYSCDLIFESLRESQHLNQRLVTKILEADKVHEVEITEEETKEPVRPVSPRVRRMQAVHAGFQRVQELKKEFDSSDA
jgi:hypothetical protein